MESWQSSEPARQTAGLSSLIRALGIRTASVAEFALGKITRDAVFQDSGYSLSTWGPLLRDSFLC